MGADDEFDEVRKMINRMLSDAVQGKAGHEPEPFVRGFAGRVRGREEEHAPRRFIVQIPPDPSLPPPEVFEAGEAIYVTMDLGGRTPSSVRTRVSGRLLLIEVEGARPVQRVVELPCEVESNVRCAVREGVLDLTLQRKAKAPAP